MRLSQHSDYAFRMLIHAALRAPALTTVGEVATDFQLSRAHLQKVAQTLAANAYLQTVRGGQAVFAWRVPRNWSGSVRLH